MSRIDELKAQMAAIQAEIRTEKATQTREELAETLSPVFDAIDDAIDAGGEEVKEFFLKRNALRVYFKDSYVNRETSTSYKQSKLSLGGKNGVNGKGRQIEIDMNDFPSKAEYAAEGYEGDWKRFPSGAAACTALEIEVNGGNAHKVLQSKLFSCRIRSVSTTSEVK